MYITFRLPHSRARTDSSYACSSSESGSRALRTASPSVPLENGAVAIRMLCDLVIVGKRPMRPCLSLVIIHINTNFKTSKWGLKSKNHELSEPQSALGRLKAPRVWAHLSILRSWKLAVRPIHVCSKNCPGKNPPVEQSESSPYILIYVYIYI